VTVPTPKTSQEALKLKRGTARKESEMCAKEGNRRERRKNQIQANKTCCRCVDLYRSRTEHRDIVDILWYGMDVKKKESTLPHRNLTAPAGSSCSLVVCHYRSRPAAMRVRICIKGTTRPNSPSMSISETTCGSVLAAPFSVPLSLCLLCRGISATNFGTFSILSQPPSPLLRHNALPHISHERAETVDHALIGACRRLRSPVSSCFLSCRSCRLSSLLLVVFICSFLAFSRSLPASIPPLANLFGFASFSVGLPWPGPRRVLLQCEVRVRSSTRFPGCGCVNSVISTLARFFGLARLGRSLVTPLSFALVFVCAHLRIVAGRESRQCLHACLQRARNSRRAHTESPQVQCEKNAEKGLFCIGCGAPVPINTAAVSDWVWAWETDATVSETPCAMAWQPHEMVRLFVPDHAE
jgi:hypothetical protein